MKLNKFNYDLYAFLSLMLVLMLAPESGVVLLSVPASDVGFKSPWYNPSVESLPEGFYDDALFTVIVRTTPEIQLGMILRSPEL